MYFEKNKFADNNFPFRERKFSNSYGKNAIGKETNPCVFVSFPYDFVINVYAFTFMLRSMKGRKHNKKSGLVCSFYCFNRPNLVALQLLYI